MECPEESMAMKEIKWILFDCMETLVDLTDLPDFKEYALWTFLGSGAEHYWSGFKEFLEGYKNVRAAMLEKLPEHKEYELKDRLDRIVRNKLDNAGDNEINTVIGRLYENFWDNYVSRCYVRNEVKIVLQNLSRFMRFGVVSNFTVQNGIEELLKRNDIIKYFDFIVTSVNEGWRKPHPFIYQAALEQIQMPPDRILFVGDNFECDYQGPRKMGMRSLLLDRCGRYEQVRDKVKDFYELRRLFQKD